VYFSYNSITMEVEDFQQFDQRAVYSDDGSTYLYTEFTIAVRAFWHPKSGAMNGVTALTGTAATTMDSIRSSLLTPRKQLTISAPLGGTASSTVFLKSPLSKPTTGSYYCDAKLGPQPLYCNIQEITGEEAMLVDFAIVTWVNECPGSVSVPVSPVLSHRWSMSHAIGDDFKTRRIVAGQAVFRSDLLYDANGAFIIKPDDFRKFLFQHIPANFKRVSVNCEASSDGTRIEYAYEDQEKDAVVDPKTLIDFCEIADIDGVYTETVHPASGVSLSDIGAGALAGAGLGGLAGPVGSGAGAIAGGLAKAIGGLFPSKSNEVFFKIIGTRNSTRAQLVRLACRAAAGFRLGNVGSPTQLNVQSVLRAFLQNFYLESQIQVGLVSKWVQIRVTMRTPASLNAVQVVAGFLTSVAPNAVESPLPPWLRWVISATIPNPMVWNPFGIFTGGASGGTTTTQVANALNFFIGDANTPGIVPVSAYDPLFPEDIPGITKTQGRVSDNYGPRGDAVTFGGETNSRGTALTHLVTAALQGPCTNPIRPPRQPDQTYYQPEVARGY
jgi:hypothetical protein